MLEFTPTADDAVDLARWLAQRNFGDARGQLYFRVIGFCLGTLGGALAGWAVGIAAGVPPRLPASIGLVAGAAGWIALMVVRPHLFRDWSDRRTARHARREFCPRGLVRVWLDDDGVNTLIGPVHTHLAWLGIESVFEAGNHVVVARRFFGPALTVPRRIGDAQVDWFAASIRVRLSAPSPDETESIRVFAGPRRSEAHQYAHRRDTLTFTTTVVDLQALASEIERREPQTRARRDFRRVHSGRAIVLSLVALSAANRAWFGLTGWAALTLFVPLSLLSGVVAWWSAASAFSRRELQRAEPEVRHRLAASGDRRLLWLDDAGLGQEDATTVVHTSWPALELAETPEYYFVHGPERFGVVLPRRVPGADDFAHAVRARAGRPS